MQKESLLNSNLLVEFRRGQILIVMNSQTVEITFKIDSLGVSPIHNGIFDHDLNNHVSE
jgi:hypothetical protein